MRRGGPHRLSGYRHGARRGDCLPHRRSQTLPLLVRLRPPAGGCGRISRGPGPLRPLPRLPGGIRRPGVQDRPGPPGRPAHLSQSHRRHAEGEGPSLRRPGERPLGGKGRPAPHLLGQPLPDSERGPRRYGVRRHRPEPHLRRGGAGHGGRRRPPAAGAGAHLSGHPARRVRPPHRPAQTAGAGGGGPPAPPGVERAPAGDPYPAHGRGAAGDPAPAHRPAVWSGGLLRPGQYRLPGDHRRPGGGRGPL